MTDKPKNGGPAQIIARVREHYDGWGLEKPWPDFEKDMEAVIHVITASGYVITRKEPTEEMIRAGREKMGLLPVPSQMREGWFAMLAAGGHDDD
jgi:hypothetical protein